MSKTQVISIVAVVIIGAVAVIAWFIGFGDGYRRYEAEHADLTEVEDDYQDDAEIFEGFITWVTDNQGASMFDFDISYAFHDREIGDVDLTLHVYKGDIID